MCKSIFIIVSVLIVACHANSEINRDVARAKLKYHHHGLYHGLRHYWIFLAIKAKIIFLVATFISFWIFAGKAFAFLYYISRKEGCKCSQYHEKVVLPEEPHFDDKYSTLNSGPPINYNPGFEGPPLSPYNSYERYSPYSGRSFTERIFSKKGFIKSLIRNTDLTEIAFHEMKLEKNSCRKRFVCELEQETRNNGVLTFGMYIFSDVAFNRYKTNATMNSINDCYVLGPDCKQI